MAKKPKIRIKVATELGCDVRYIYADERGYWRMTHANGTPLAMCDVLEDRDETALRFELEDARTPDEAVKAVRKRLTKIWRAHIH